MLQDCRRQARPSRPLQVSSVCANTFSLATGSWIESAARRPGATDVGMKRSGWRPQDRYRAPEENDRSFIFVSPMPHVAGVGQKGLIGRRTAKYDVQVPVRRPWLTSFARRKGQQMPCLAAFSRVSGYFGGSELFHDFADQPAVWRGTAWQTSSD